MLSAPYIASPTLTEPTYDILFSKRSVFQVLKKILSKNYEFVYDFKQLDEKYHVTCLDQSLLMMKSNSAEMKFSFQFEK